MPGPARAFAWTLFIQEDEISQRRQWLGELFENQEANMKYLVFQFERTSTGRVHIQAFVRFKSPHRWPWVKRLLGNEIHIEEAKATDLENKAYCTKEESRLAEGLVLGQPAAPGSRSDIARVCAQVLAGTSWSELAEANPVEFVRFGRGLRDLRATVRPRAARSFRQVSVLVFWGAAGSGKTKSAFEQHGYEESYVLEFKGGSRPLYWDGYAGENCVILDDFYGWMPYSMLLRVLDGHPYKVDQRGRWSWAQWTTVIITSNKHPSQWYKQGLTPALGRRLTEIREFRLSGFQGLRNEVTG